MRNVLALSTVLVTVWLGCTPSQSPEPVVVSPPRVAPADTSLAASSSAALPSVPTPARAADPLAPLLQAAIDAKELEPYWHVTERPERAPLVMRRSGPLLTEPKLSKFGQPVVYVADAELGSRPHLSLTTLRVAPDAARVVLEYGVEGVVADIELARETSGAWAVTKAHVRER